MSTLTVDALTNQEVQLCKGWVNFNGSGTVAIRSSYNVSSITDNGTGNYTVSFTVAMADANYTVAGSASSEGVNNTDTFIAPVDTLIGSTNVVTNNSAGSVTNRSLISVVVFGN